MVTWTIEIWTMAVNAMISRANPDYAGEALHLFELQKDATDPAERYKLLRQFEMRMLTEAYNVPLLWWQRIVVMSAKVKGWEMSPSHLIGQDLEKVWLAP